MPLTPLQPTVTGSQVTVPADFHNRVFLMPRGLFSYYHDYFRVTKFVRGRGGAALSELPRIITNHPDLLPKLIRCSPIGSAEVTNEEYTDALDLINVLGTSVEASKILVFCTPGSHTGVLLEYEISDPVIEVVEGCVTSAAGVGFLIPHEISWEQIAFTCAILPGVRDGSLILNL